MLRNTEDILWNEWKVWNANTERRKKDPISGVRNADLIQMKSQIWLEKMSSVNMEIISLI